MTSVPVHIARHQVTVQVLACILFGHAGMNERGPEQRRIRKIARSKWQGPGKGGLWLFNPYEAHVIVQELKECG